VQNSDAQSLDTTVHSPVTSAPATHAEPRYTDEDVNRIVASKKQSAYEKGVKDGRSEFSQPSYQSNTYQQNPSQVPDIESKINSVVEQRLAAERETQLRQYQEQEAQSNAIKAMKIAEDFKNRIKSASSKYPEIEKNVLSLNYQSRGMGDLVHLAMDHGEYVADIMNELHEHPTKLISLQNLAADHPHAAKKELEKLVASIKQNEEAAKNQQKVREPLSQMSPSNIGLDSGYNSPSDYRNAPWLRG